MVFMVLPFEWFQRQRRAEAGFFDAFGILMQRVRRAICASREL
jgi:hypothetical protein